MSFDHQMMSRALQLAVRGSDTVTPNPAVGCVIVADGEVIAEGWHQQAGGPHAEVHALNGAGEAAKGATAYVTLEPCSHHGRTPPCAEALVAAGITRVIYAMQDPNPQVAGKGLARLREAGIQVDGPLLEQQARNLNRGFIKRQQTGLPWVTVKLAMSLDGRTAMASGESQWITGDEARRDVQRLRAQSCAIVTGINTVLADQARLTVRADELKADDVKAGQAGDSQQLRQPLRVVLDSQQRLPADAPILACGDKILQIIAEPVEQSGPQGRLEQVALPGAEGIDLNQLMTFLGERQCNHILVEAGSTLAGSFLRQGLADEVVVYMAPTLLGSDARPLFELPLTMMDQQLRLQISDVRAVGDDLRITFSPEQ